MGPEIGIIILFVLLVVLVMAWPSRRGAQTAEDILRPAIPDKGGINDLSRWEQFGGTLKRPPPPKPSVKKRDTHADGP